MRIPAAVRDHEILGRAEGVEQVRQPRAKFDRHPGLLAFAERAAEIDRRDGLRRVSGDVLEIPGERLPRFADGDDLGPAGTERSARQQEMASEIIEPGDRFEAIGEQKDRRRASRRRAGVPPLDLDRAGRLGSIEPETRADGDLGGVERGFGIGEHHARRGHADDGGEQEEAAGCQLRLHTRHVPANQPRDQFLTRNPLSPTLRRS